jgi:hypothetical protein
MEGDDIHFNNICIYIDADMYHYFGKEIEIKGKTFKHDKHMHYTYTKDGWDFLKEWFEDFTFIKEDEFRIV